MQSCRLRRLDLRTRRVRDCDHGSFGPKKIFSSAWCGFYSGRADETPLVLAEHFRSALFLRSWRALSSPKGQSGGPAALVPHGRRGEGPLGVPDVLRGADRSRAELLRLVARRSALRLATLRRSGRRQRKQQQQESPPLLRARLAPRAPAAPDACAGFEICAPPHPPPCPP